MLSDLTGDKMRAGIVNFTCTSCGTHVTTYRWINYRTIPPSMDERDLCEACKKSEEGQMNSRYASIDRVRLIQMLNNYVSGVYETIDRRVVADAATLLAANSVLEPDLNPAALETTTIQLPALEIEWSVQNDPQGMYRIEARHKRADQIMFGLYMPLGVHDDIEEICRRLRAALEAAVHTYRSPKT